MWGAKTGKPLKSTGDDQIFHDQAVRLMAVLQELAIRRRNATTGVRMPHLLGKVLDMIDNTGDDGHGFDPGHFGNQLCGRPSKNTSLLIKKGYIYLKNGPGQTTISPI